MKRVYQIALGDPISNGVIGNGKWYKDAKDALIERISLIAFYENAIGAKIIWDDSREFHRRGNDPNTICINEGRVIREGASSKKEAYIQMTWQDVKDDFITTEPTLPVRSITREEMNHITNLNDFFIQLEKGEIAISSHN